MAFHLSETFADQLLSALPGVVYLLSTWYTRYEVGKRYAFFYLIGCVASAFGGILAFGLMQMEGIAGMTLVQSFDQAFADSS